MVSLEECQALTRQCQLDVPDRMIGTVFAESLMTVIDTMKNKDKQMSMQYAEFVYFLCRMTDVHYSNTIYEQEPFYIKLDNLIAFLFDPFDLVPQFRFGAKFTANQLATASSKKSYIENEEIIQEDV